MNYFDMCQNALNAKIYRLAGESQDVKLATSFLCNFAPIQPWRGTRDASVWKEPLKPNFPQFLVRVQGKISEGVS